MAFSPDFELMVTGSDDERVRVFNAVTGKHIVKLKGHEGNLVQHSSHVNFEMFQIIIFF